MYTSAPAQFSKTLRRALDRVAFLEGKTSQMIFDEIGYAMGRSGGSPLQYWVYHKKAPSRLEDIEALARILTQRKGWEKESDLSAFLHLAGHPAADLLAQQILYAATPEADPHTALTESGFTAGAPQRSPAGFFGRGQTLRRILSAFNPQAMQPVWLSGPPLSGKTSLLLYLQSTPRFVQAGAWRNSLAAYRWVFIDFQDPRVQTPLAFFNAALTQLQAALPAQPDLGQAIDRLCQAAEAPTVILLDEFPLAAANPDFNAAFWASLKALSTHLTGGKLTFLAASNSDFLDQPQTQGVCRPFVEMFAHHLNLGPLESEEALALIDSGPLRFSPEDRAWIAAQSQGWPAQLQALCALRLFSLQEGQPEEIWKAEALRTLLTLRSAGSADE
jgi:hypothetical protein